MTYPGGKNHCYQKIINLIPPHRVYIETHLGSGAVARMKRPADRSILIDLDPDVIRTAGSVITENGDAAVELVNVDAAEFLQNYQFHGDEFIYSDPPYVMEARRQQRQIYRYEYTRQQHVALLTVLTALPCRVMISGYWSDLYEEMLAGWNVETFEAMTRGGSMATEVLWMNYPAPVDLHDYRYLGDTFRERERIKRKKQRWLNKLRHMDILERQAISAAIAELDNEGRNDGRGPNQNGSNRVERARRTQGALFSPEGGE